MPARTSTSFILRVTRSRRGVLGLVESVEGGHRATFRDRDELWEIVIPRRGRSTQGAVRRPGTTDGVEETPATGKQSE